MLDVENVICVKYFVDQRGRKEQIHYHKITPPTSGRQCLATYTKHIVVSRNVYLLEQKFVSRSVDLNTQRHCRSYETLSNSRSRIVYLCLFFPNRTEDITNALVDLQAVWGIKGANWNQRLWKGSWGRQNVCCQILNRETVNIGLYLGHSSCATCALPGYKLSICLSQVRHHARSLRIVG